MDGLTVGRIVHYVLTEDDCKTINERRRIGKQIDDSRGVLDGLMVYAGNHAIAGQHMPMMVVAVWPNEYGPNFDGVNGQVFLDGNDSYWVTSKKYDDTPEVREERFLPGTWHWIEKA